MGSTSPIKSAIETSGVVTLGTPGTLSWDSVNGLTTHSHTHGFEDSGVVAGTYNSVTVNAKGFVEAATNETIPETFLDLTDTPSTYTGQATKFLKVKSDETGVEFVTVTPSGLQIGDWVEDIAFEFCDITAGTAQTYTLDIKASYGYTIEAACLETDDGTLTGVAVKIGATAVTSLSSLTVDTAVDETASTAAKTVVAGDRVYLTTSTGYTGTPTLIRGKLKTVRT